MQLELFPPAYVVVRTVTGYSVSGPDGILWYAGFADNLSEAEKYASYLCSLERKKNV